MWDNNYMSRACFLKVQDHDACVRDCSRAIEVGGQDDGGEDDV